MKNPQICKKKIAKNEEKPCSTFLKNTFLQELPKPGFWVPDLSLIFTVTSMEGQFFVKTKIISQAVLEGRWYIDRQKNPPKMGRIGCAC